MATNVRSHFVFGFPLNAEAWQRYDVRSLLPAEVPTDPGQLSQEIRALADNLRTTDGDGPPAEMLLALRTIDQMLRQVAHQKWRQVTEPLASDGPAADDLWDAFYRHFPGRDLALSASDTQTTGISPRPRCLEMLIVAVTNDNPAAQPARTLFDDAALRQEHDYLADLLATPISGESGQTETLQSLWKLLKAPILASPDSLTGQLEYIRTHWAHLLPPEMLQLLALALDVLLELDVTRSAEYGPPPVLTFETGDSDSEYEAFSADAPWMSDVVLMAKTVYVWLDQLSRSHGRSITRLDEIPDQELDRLAEWGVTALWLIGLWQRSDASRQIKQQMGNPDAAASAYALDDYRIADDLGGQDAWQNLSERAGQRGIRLASDMVPNHMGIDSRWVREHPEYFVQLDHAPYPAYRFDGPDLCDDPQLSIRIEDGYRDHSDAAVVFQRIDHRSGDVRYIYHGNDGTSMPWNDTAQLNFLLPEVREAVIQVILAVARRFPIIRFDAAMTLAKKHYQRLWFPQPGDAGAIPSRAEHGLDKPAFDAVFPVEFWREVVDRVAREVPDTLLLAEAFWLMEGYFVRTLGMHRVYNSAFMNMLKMEENAEYRQTIKNVLEFSPAILQRFVNFMNNPDELTAVQQFGDGDKYFGCTLLLVTLPGLPMLGHGQIEGFREKYGMEYRKAYWEERVDQDLVSRHEREIFPLLRQRHLFSGAEHFTLFDFETEYDGVNENVFAYANRAGEHASLVIYNNKDVPTGGTVKLSTAINTGSAEAPQLVRRSLGEALQIESSPGVWYLFRDPIRQLEYLQRGSVLAHEGFALHLDGYEYRVLLDFKRVHESDGPWADIADVLRGEGTADIERVRRRLALAPELAELRSWARPELLQAVRDDRWRDIAIDDLPPALAKALATPWTLPKLGTLGPRSQSDLASVYENLRASDIPQALYLQGVIDQIELEAGAENDLPIYADELSEVVQQWTNDWRRARHIVTLAMLLWRGRRHLQAMAQGKVAWFPELLQSRDAEQFLDINRYEGKTYLNRESLRILTRALVILADPESSAPGLLDAQALILNAAEATGYEFHEFANRLKTGK